MAQMNVPGWPGRKRRDAWMTEGLGQYPGFWRRFRALCIDGLLLSIAGVGTIILLSALGVENGPIDMAAALLVVLMLEPVMVATLGGTIGHRLQAMRVRRVDADVRLSLWAASLRFLLRNMLGVLSVPLMMATRQRQGLHDLLSGSVVVFAEASGSHPYDAVPALDRTGENRNWHHRGRRVLLILAWWMAAYAVFSLSALISMAVLGANAASTAVTVLFLLLLAVVLGCAVLGWLGYLPGARRMRLT